MYRSMMFCFAMAMAFELIALFAMIMALISHLSGNG